MAGSPSASVPTRKRTVRLRRLAGPYQVLGGNRALLLLVLGRGLVTLSATLYEVALTAAAYLLTHSAAAVSALTVVRLLPMALFLSFAGSLIDRFDRRRLMVMALAGQAVCLGALVL